MKGILTLPFTALIATIPYLANPGFFSFITIPVIALENKAEIRPASSNHLNSQNMGLLQAAVNFDPNPAKGGGDITIIDNVALKAESGVSGTTLDIEKSEHAGQISVYEVRDGDTLSQISEMFGVSANTIKWANELEGSIQPGQTLVILPVSGITHTVKNGGNIADIAKIYKADVKEIALFNGLSEDQELQPGDEVIVPNAEIVTDKDEDHDHSHGSTQIAVSGGTAASVSSTFYTNPVPGGIITQGVHGYNGIDIGASAGTPVLAAASGKVITSKQGGWNGGYGNMIVISHNNGTQTLYSHNSRNAVYVGQYVEKGEVIGYVGSTGQSTGNHLHFEVRGASNPLKSCRVGGVCW